jgi:hypothetical protein
MPLRSLVRLALVLVVLAVPVSSAVAAGAAQTAVPREQKRLGKMSVLKTG